MIKNRPLALLLLFLVLIILGHSVISLFQGKFQQAMVMTPLLIIIYVFGLAKKDGSAPDQYREKPPSETKSEDDSEE